MRKMIRSGRAIRAALVLFALFMTAASGCASKEEKEAKHLRDAREYVKEGEYEKAVIEFRNVVQLNPRNDAAYYELGEAYLRLKKGREAFKSFARAVSANPENFKAQLKMGQIYLLGRRTADAREKAELILEKSPEDVEALLLLSGVLVQERKTDEAIATLKKAIDLDPDQFKGHLSLARLSLLKGDLAQAERSYLKALALEPKARVPYVELATIYTRKGEVEKAEALLKKMLAQTEAPYQALPILARFYEGTRRPQLAEKTYQEAVEQAPPGDAGPLMNLAGFYVRSRDYGNALETMEKAAQVKKDDPGIRVSIAQLHFDFKKFAEAEKVLDRVLEKDQGHVRANFLKGRLSLMRRDVGDALNRFDLVVRERPRDARAHYFKALALLGKGEGKLAEKDLVKAVELNPRLVEARLILAQGYVRQGNKDMAREQLDKILALAPNNVKALTLDGGLRLLERDVKGAEASYRKAVELAPNRASGYVKLGLLYNMTKRRDQARKAFEKAISLNPRQIDALTFLVSMHTAKKDWDRALRLCEEQKARVKDDTLTQARIAYLEGTVHLARNDKAKAQALFEASIQTNPNILGPYLALSRIYVSEKRYKEAISQHEAILKKNPGHLASYLAIGSIYDHLGEGEKAETYYRKALEVKKDFGPAANNLAWNLAERGQNIDEALSYAQIAKEQLPDNPGVMDTLGWVYYLKGRYPSAIAEFRDSLEKAPENPIINYHLGMAYFRNNEPEKAREALEKALRISKAFKGAQEAQETLEAIRRAGPKG